MVLLRRLRSAYLAIGAALALNASVPSVLASEGDPSLQRESERNFQLGFLYLADGMSSFHEKRPEERTAAAFQRGLLLLRRSRELRLRAVERAQAAGGEIPAIQVDWSLLQGNPAARAALNALEASYQLRWAEFHGRILENTLRSSQDLLAPVLAVMVPVDGADTEPKLRDLLAQGTGRTEQETAGLLAASGLPKLEEEYHASGARSEAAEKSGAWPSGKEGALKKEPGKSLPPGHGAADRPLPPPGAPRPPVRPPPRVLPPQQAASAVQRAAHAAALAGARVASRQIRLAAVLNWEMRRALKEFLFAQQVIGGMEILPCFPLDSSGRALSHCGQPRPEERFDFAFRDPREQTAEQGGPFIPGVCRIVDAAHNFCMRAGVPGAPEYLGKDSWTGSDPISAGGAGEPILKLSESCAGRSQLNRAVLREILLGMDPVSGSSRVDPFPGRSGLERLGLLPRLALLRARISTIESWLNLDLEASGFRDVEEADLAVLRARGPVFDRPRAAFEAATASLRASGAGAVELRLKEAGGAARQPRFLDETAAVQVASQVFETKGDSDRGDCFSFRRLRAVPALLYGVRAGPSLYEPYSVEVSVRIDGAESRASASAQPKSVLLGPELPPGEEGDFQGRVAKAKASQADSAETRTPNPLILAGETSSNEGGFQRSAHLGYLRAAASSFDRWDLGARLAGAMAPWELNRFSFPCDGGDGGELFAPVPLSGDIAGDLKTQLGRMLGTGQDTKLLERVLDGDSLRRLRAYLEESRQLAGHRVPDPLLRDDPDLQQYARKFGARFTVAGDPDAPALLRKARGMGHACEAAADLIR